MNASPGGLAGLGVQFVVVVLVFLLAGRWLDSKLGTAPWLLIVSVFVGATVSFVAMYRQVFPSDTKPPTPPVPPAS
jgi:F0F1-type ATP synthase assembly protein I